MPTRARRTATRRRPRNWEWVPAEVRQQLDRWAQEWLTGKFSKLLALRAQDPGPFNYPVEVFSEWRGKAFYLCARPPDAASHT